MFGGLVPGHGLGWVEGGKRIKTRLIQDYTPD
jgi:hypothetical protein